MKWLKTRKEKKNKHLVQVPVKKSFNDIVYMMTKENIVFYFYTMLRWHDVKSENIAVIKNRKAYDTIVNHFRFYIRKNTEDREIAVGDSKHIFMIGEREKTILYINRLEELDNYKIKIGRYI